MKKALKFGLIIGGVVTAGVITVVLIKKSKSSERTTTLTSEQLKADADRSKAMADLKATTGSTMSKSGIKIGGTALNIADTQKNRVGVEGFISEVAPQGQEQIF